MRLLARPRRRSSSSRLRAETANLFYKQVAGEGQATEHYNEAAGEYQAKELYEQVACEGPDEGA